MFTYSPQDNFFFLISTTVFFVVVFFVMVVHESLVCSEQFKLSTALQKNPPCPAHSSVSSIFRKLHVSQKTN